MKRLLQSLAVSVLTVGMMSGVAAAATTDFSCTISGTGPDSVNTCVNTVNDTTTFFCNNNVNFDNTNVQTGQSGTVTVNGNGSGGSASSGNVDNSTFTNVSAQLGCETAAVTPTAPTGGSGGEVLGTTAPQVVAPVGGVGAGAGAGVASNKLAATAGLVGSAGVVGLGLALKKRAFGRN